MRLSGKILQHSRLSLAMQIVFYVNGIGGESGSAMSKMVLSGVRKV
jgi:hypothetical protein